MDITKSSNTIKATKYFNGETVNYSLFYALGLFVFFIFKQVLKGTIFNLAASTATLIPFVLINLALFFVEKKFVFSHDVSTKTPRQLIGYIFRCGVDFGFYKIFDFAFVEMLEMSKYLPFLFTVVIAFVFNYYFDRLVVFDATNDVTKSKNGKIFKIAYNNRFVLTSMAIALVSLLFIFIVFKLFPFGDITVLRMDLYHQYGPLFAEFYDRIVEHKSFFYSWQSGGGSSFLGNYFNYLSSPLSFLVFLFDRNQIGFAITALVVVKGVLSAGAFSYFLKSSFKTHSPASAAFGVFYAYCGYFLAYYWNIMWIDGMILLPLIALGIERIINNGKCKLYIISLAVLLFSSYYMGYMACIFSVLYFFMYYFAYNDPSDKINSINESKGFIKKALNNKFLVSAIRFGCSSIFVGAICAFFLLPIYYILQSCSATSDSFPSAVTSNFNLIDMFSSFLDGLETTIRSSGDDVLPNISCGMFAVVLLPLYLMNKDIRLKEKVSYVLMLIFLIISFDCNVLEFIWHAFHFPNDLPFRFSYMFVFIMLIISFRGLMHIKSIEYKDIVVVGLVLALVVMLYQKFPTNKISEFSIYTSIAFVIVWVGVLLLIKKGYATKFIIGATILCMTFCEIIISNSNSYVFTVENNDYTQNMSTYQEALKYIKDNDKGFYRTELTYLDTRMDPSLYGYDGMSIFSSMAYEDYSQSQYSQGMAGNRINSYTYNTQTPVYNMFYNVKYLVKNKDTISPSNDYYKKIHTTKDNAKTEVYKNNYYLPIAFATSDGIQDWDNSEGNPFEVQENLIDLATGVKNVFVPVEYISTEADTCTCSEVTENGSYEYYDNDADGYGTIEITLKNTLDSNLYIYVTSDAVDNVNYFWNNDADTEYQNIDEPFIKDLGSFKKGDTVRVSLDLSGTNASSSSFKIYAYNVNKELLDAAYELLSLGSMNVEKHTDTRIEGTIEAGYDGFLYTSIPYDEGWSVYIDGKKTTAFSIGESNLCTTIKAGKRQIKFVYEPTGKKKGALISLCALIALAGVEITKLVKPSIKFKKNEK